MLLAVMGPPDAVSACLDRLGAFGILELTRSGRIAMTVTGTPHLAGVTAPAPNGPYTWQADGAIDEEAA
jgi:hypothetical protein